MHILGRRVAHTHTDGLGGSQCLLLEVNFEKPDWTTRATSRQLCRAVVALSEGSKAQSEASAVVATQPSWWGHSAAGSCSRVTWAATPAQAAAAASGSALLLEGTASSHSLMSCISLDVASVFASVAPTRLQTAQGVGWGDQKHILGSHVDAESGPATNGINHCVDAGKRTSASHHRRVGLTYCWTQGLGRPSRREGM